jgi:regulator of sirC expression with transglutaminase-like and TPR domain
MRHHALLIVIALAACGHRRPPPPRDPVASTPAAELVRRALVFERAGDGVRAEQYLVAAIDNGFPEEEAIEALLRVCIADSRFGAALRHAEAFRDRHPDAWDASYVVAALAGAIGDTARQRAELERVVARWPEQAAPHYALAEILAAAGDRRAAAARLGAYLDLAPDGEHAIAARARLRELKKRRR